VFFKRKAASKGSWRAPFVHWSSKRNLFKQSFYKHLFWFWTVGFQTVEGNCPHNLITTHNGFVVCILASENLLIGNQKCLF